MESDVITLQNLYEFKVQHAGPDRSIAGSLERTGLRPSFLAKFERRGIPIPHGMSTTGAGAFGAPAVAR
jgi:hypothetical protein